MNILIEAHNDELYFAKTHESYRTGLRRLFNAKCYGVGYPDYDESITSFVDIAEKTWGAVDNVDLIILADCWNPRELEKGLRYDDLSKLNCIKAIMLCDYWSEAESQFDKYEQFIEENGIDYILSFFRGPFFRWKGSKVYNKLIWFPPSFDPQIFNDWKKCKSHDVGNLNAGIFEKGDFYPERYEFHRIISDMKDVNYFYAKHPGYGYHSPDDYLIGKSFSEAINSCKIFITSGGNNYGNMGPKYVETMASGSCLFATEPLDSEFLGLEDGVNYVCINADNLRDKVEYYLCHEEERLKISANGYELAMKRYCSYAVAWLLYEEILKRLK